MILKFLFLPAYANITRYAGVTSKAVDAGGGLNVLAVDIRNGDLTGGTAWTLARLSRAIRLASRSELFGCSVDGVGLLFLPAAERIWSSSAGLAFSNGGVSAIRLNVALPMSGELRDRRYKLFSLRLASREDCLDVMSVVFGLLFLPAAGNYWTVDADSSRETVARSLRLENKVLQAFANSRWGRFCIRLASREDCPLLCRC